MSLEVNDYSLVGWMSCKGQLGWSDLQLFSLIFCLPVLSLTEWFMIKLLTIIVGLSLSPFSFISFAQCLLICYGHKQKWIWGWGESIILYNCVVSEDESAGDIEGKMKINLYLSDVCAFRYLWRSPDQVP